MATGLIFDTGEAGTTGLADRLKAATWSLHREAERSGILHDLLRSRCGPDGYTLYLRNLLPVYEAIEGALASSLPPAPAAALARPAIYRAVALRSDLDQLAGPSWRETAPLPGARRYAARVAEAAAAENPRLIAHAYVRYLGDLNGGQILARLVGKALDLQPGQLSFYAFPALGDPDAAALDYREAIDRAVLSPAEAADVIEEAGLAFRLNIDLSLEVAQEARLRSGSAALA